MSGENQANIKICGVCGERNGEIIFHMLFYLFRKAAPGIGQSVPGTSSEYIYAQSQRLLQREMPVVLEGQTSLDD